MKQPESQLNHSKPQEISKARTERKEGVFRALGLGLITGAADDDCSAIGTYASAGAKFGPSLLWTAPVTFPMMFAVVYLSSKLGQVSGKGLFAVIRDHYPRWLLYLTLVGVLIGNTFEAAADIGAMAAALNLFIPVPIHWIVVPVSLTILALQIWGSYTLIRNVFRWLALSLLAYNLFSHILDRLFWQNPSCSRLLRERSFRLFSLTANFLQSSWRSSARHYPLIFILGNRTRK